jgi:hypothetical protein
LSTPSTCALRHGDRQRQTAATATVQLLQTSQRLASGERRLTALAGTSKLPRSR